MIVSCKGKDFKNNIKVISDYVLSEGINNQALKPDYLIHLLSIYLQSLIFYKNNVLRKYIVVLNKKPLIIKFGNSDDTGKEHILDFIEIGGHIVIKIFKDLSNTNVTKKTFEKLQKLLIEVINSKHINFVVKFSIIHSETNDFRQTNDNLLFLIEEELAFQAISNRINLIYYLLKNKDNQQYKDNSDKIFSLFNDYIKFYFKNCIYRNHFIKGINIVDSELDKFNQNNLSDTSDKNELINIILDSLITYNNLFQLISKEVINEYFDDYKKYLNNSNQSKLLSHINFNPNNFSLDDFNFKMVSPGYGNTDLNELTSHIYFVIQVSGNWGDFSIIKDGILIEFKKINNLYDDPIFSMYDSTNLNLNGMPLSIFSDTVGNISTSCQITFNINNFYHPDFEIVNGTVKQYDLSLTKAKHGGKYYPHKDLLVEILYKLKNENKLPFDLKKEDINSSLISNYYILYKNRDKVIDQKIYSITNFNSFYKLKERYFENINRFELENNSSFRDFMNNFEIFNSKQFLEFCYFFLEKTIKKSIEYGGLYKNMWTDKKGELTPILEVKAQLIIYNQIRLLLEMNGVSILREPVSANGSLDFYFHYTLNNKSLKVCVELKNGHHQEVDTGNYKQLSEYINDTGDKEGIYLVLWYKSNNFKKPTKYKSIDDLQKKLDSNPTKGLRIKNMIIDCSNDKISPSKKR
ncbi:MAG: hypothetical protein QM486_09205 [Flavobacteriaceae bacterium]